jgi:hypothetical protein
MLEVLEDRCLLSRTLDWTGQGGVLNWTDPKNWQDAKTKANVRPTADDDVVFIAAFNVSSIVNRGQSFEVKSLTVEAGYTKTLDLLGNLKVVGGPGAKDSTIADPNFDLTGPGTFTLGSSTVLKMSAGTISNAELILGSHAVFTMTGGTMKGKGTTVIGDRDVTKAATLNFAGNAAKNIDDRTIINYGTINWTGGGDIVLSNDATITNMPRGKFNANPTNANLVTRFGTDSFTNATDAELNVNTTTTFGTLKFINAGTLNVKGGVQFTIQHETTDFGTFNLQAGSSVLFDGAGDRYTLADATVKGAGTLELKGGATLNVMSPTPRGLVGILGGAAGAGVLGTLGPSATSVSTIQNFVDAAGGVVTGDGTLLITGSYKWNGADWEETGKVEIAGGATLTIGGGAMRPITDSRPLIIDTNALAIWSGRDDIDASIITNNGTFDIRSNQAFPGPLPGGVAGTFVNNGTLKKSAGGGVSKIGLTFSNSGSVQVQSGTLELDETATQTAGSTTLASGTTLKLGPQGTQTYTVNGGTLSNSGIGTATVDGNLTVNGAATQIAPGIAANAGLGTLNVIGTYKQNNGTLVIYVNTNAGVNTQLRTINATLGGTLLANTIGNPPNNTYTIIDYAVLANDFTTKNLQGQYTTNPNGPNLIYQLIGNGNPPNIAAAPSVTGLSVATGPTTGGTAVTISGTGFTGATTVAFGGVAATFTVNSSTSISATSPAHAPGLTDVTVTTPGGTSINSPSDLFTYTGVPSVSSLSTSLGSTGGGNSVTLTGSGFTGTAAVLFGKVLASTFTVTSDTSITVVVPANVAGTDDVTVSNASGTSALNSNDRYSYVAVAAPAVTSLGTSTGTTAGGTSVVVNGSGFTGAQDVTFGGVDASSFVVNSDSQITAVAPPNSAGTVDVVVATPTGTSATSTSDQFTYTNAAAPTVTSLPLNSGSTAGGTTVTVLGSGFTGATAVNFGSVAATDFTVLSDGTLTATAPAQAAGMVDVTVATFSGTSASTSADHFTYTSAGAPAVTGLATSTGTTAGGTAVTINGSGFTGASEVDFGSVAAASFSVLSDTQISAVSPPQAAGSISVTVTTFAGTSAPGGASQFSYTNAAAPSVSGISANSGSAAGGQAVTVTGSGFTGATAVNFGEAATDFTVLSDTALLATAPAGSAGTVDITVTSYSGTSATGSADHYTYTAVTASTITSLNPSTASTGGGTVVTISGSGFLSVDGVEFGSSPAASFTIVSDSTISAVVPPLPAGTVDVMVDADGVTSALNGSDRFTSSAANAPVVSSLGTSSGTTAGGTSVTITGSGFTGAGSVTFGGVAAASFTVNSDTSITVVSPSQAAGTVDVVVGTPTGTSATSTADHFTYTNAAAPAVTGLSLSSGSAGGGTVVTVTGSGFTGATAVNFGSVAAGFTVNGDGYLVATAPAQAAGTVDVTVTTPSGTSSTSSADHFTYTAAAAPVVTSVSPGTGGSSGGNTVTVLGSGFTGAGAVNFGSTAATDFTVLSDAALTATVPAGSAGTVDITVVSPSGTSATGAADHYQYTAVSAPAVSGLSPTSGSASGGTTVLVGGSGFTGATAVNFGGYAAAFSVNSDSMLTALAPAQAAGVVDVTVTTAAGTSSTSSSDQFTYNAAAAPTVTGVSPNTGPSSGSSAVTVSGSGFTGATAVYFGTIAAPNFSVSSDGVLYAESPAETAGTVDITVVTPNGTSATGAADRYTFQADAPLTAVAGNNFSATAGSQFNGAVASFTDTDTAGSASQFSAYIDWGDGHHTTGTVAANGYNGSGQPQFLVYGSNTYGTAGHYTVTVSIQDAGGASGQATATATVSSPPRAPGQPRPAATGTTATATHGVGFNGSVASFSGLAGAAYRATINWGNGTTTAGSIVATSATTFNVVGSNTYVAPGVYMVSITISMVGGGSTTVETTITVADATQPEDESPRAAVVASGLEQGQGQEDVFGDPGWLLDLGETEEVSLDPDCVDAVLLATVNEAADDGEPALIVLDEAIADAE